MITACLIILCHSKMIVQNIMKNQSSQRKSNITYRISLEKKNAAFDHSQKFLNKK